LNALELARNKFNALFAAHDAKDIRAPTQEQKPALKTRRKQRRTAKPKWNTDQRNAGFCTVEFVNGSVPTRILRRAPLPALVSPLGSPKSS